MKHLIQYRTRFLFPGTTKKSVPSKLTENEEQSIRYVAGYIGCSLKKAFKHSKSSEGKAMFHLICQFSAKYDDELEDTWYFNDFLEYTQLWVNHINRGGLQEVNDQFFLLIRSMEFVVRTILDLNFLITYAGEDLRSILFDKIIENGEVTRMWLLITRRLENKKLGRKLLHKIIHKWINVRLYHYAKAHIQKLKLKARNQKDKKETSVSEKADPAFRKRLASKTKKK